MLLLSGSAPTSGDRRRHNAVKEFTEDFVGNNVLGFLDLFSGGGSRRSLFALGIMPYITASIILQLLTVVMPWLGSCRRRARSAAEDHPVHALPHRRPRLGESLRLVFLFQSLAATRRQLPRELSGPKIFLLVICLTAEHAVMWSAS